MEEDTSEKLIKDLEGMEIDDLRLMARQNDLSYNGTKSQLLSRIKTHFGYQSQKMFNQESNKKKENTSNFSGAASSFLSTAGPSTSATGTASAEFLRGFVKEASGKV